MTDTITLPRSVVEQALNALWATDAEEGTETYSRELEAIKALRAALEQPDMGNPVSAPESWKLVPSALTDAQRQAAQDTWWHACNSEMYWDRIYAAMLAAAPQPPVVEQPQGEQELDAFYEWWRMRPSLTRLQAWLLWKDEQKQLERAHKIGGEA